jgi:hypothetical protein
MSERRYVVTGAILTHRGEATVWQVTFTPQPPEPGAQQAEDTDPDADREIVVAMPPADVDNMFFDATYTRADIDALGAGS